MKVDENHTVTEFYKVADGNQIIYWFPEWPSIIYEYNYENKLFTKR